MSEICVKQYAESFIDDSFKSDVMAARKAKGWQQFVHADRDKKTQRILLVAKAIDALQDVPVQGPGFEFMHNSWAQGPFYSWDKNFPSK